MGWNSRLHGASSVGGEGNLKVNPVFQHYPTHFKLNPVSPCVDAGDPDELHNDPDGSRNDMGAYGGGATAGGCPACPAGQPCELNSDCASGNCSNNTCQ